MSVRVEHGDCLKVMETLADEGLQVDSVVTDPPYHLTSIVKRFGKDGSAPAKSNGATGVYGRAAAGFMGQKWDGGNVAFRPETWQLVSALLKPGGHMLVFGGTRTYHRLACAIEDAGFEIRDAILWHYGSGFPKSHSVSKAIDKAERGVPHGGADPTSPNHGKFKGGCSEDNPSGQGFGAGPGQFMAEESILDPDYFQPELSPAAKQWDGWGTALKPATEIICLARKPLSEKTVAANVLKHGTGAINVDGCRVPLDGDYKCGANGRPSQTGLGDHYDSEAANRHSEVGRWPANVIHDGSEEVLEAFPDTGKSTGGRIGNKDGPYTNLGSAGWSGAHEAGDPGFGDSGTAARFFYCAKADKSDRLQSKHPTVKPVDLIAYLCRLITPPGGTVLDPFAGSGTTAMACLRDGFGAILIEKEARFVADIERRLAHVEGADTPLFQGAPA